MSAAHPPPISFARNREGVLARIDAALKEAGRSGPVELVAVSKTQSEERLEEAFAAGQRVFGENRVQEAQRKWPLFRARHTDIELRLIGPLQSNKAADAVALFDVIETVDRPKIAKALAEATARQGSATRFLIQVNTGEEPQKAGVAPQAADEFIGRCIEEFGLAVEGLMCIPPADEPPAPHFALLAKIAARNKLGVLSMGMSGDFEIAAQLGATHVRVGSALFGERSKTMVTVT